MENKFICENCGTSIITESKFCPECGKTIEFAKHTDKNNNQIFKEEDVIVVNGNPEERLKSKPKKFFLALLIISGILNIVFIVLLINKSNSNKNLDAIVVFDEAITRATGNFESRNERIYSDFLAAEKENPGKTKQWKAIADELQVKADEMVKYMDELKSELITKGGVNDTATNKIAAASINKKNNMTAGTQIMNGTDEGIALKKKMDEFREWIITKVNDPSLKSSFERALNTSENNHEGEESSSHYTFFSHMPLVTCIAYLSKLENDVRNAENEVLAFLYSNVDAGSFTFNKLSGTVIAKSNYVISGDPYEADIFLAAFDTTKNPTIYIGEYDAVKAFDPAITDYKQIMKGTEGTDYKLLDSIYKGKGKYRAVEGVGYHTVKGLIFFEIVSAWGNCKKVIKVPFENEYQVVQGNTK